MCVCVRVCVRVCLCACVCVYVPDFKRVCAMKIEPKARTECICAYIGQVGLTKNRFSIIWWYGSEET